MANDTQNIRSPIGESTPRIDAHDKVTGTALYTDDMQFGNALLHARIKRSPHPHALIKKINTEKALALPGVKAVVTGADFPVISACTCRTGLSFAATGCATSAIRSPVWLLSARK